MSKSKVKNINTNNDSFNIDIEELKGTKITINGDNSKYLVLYENDIAFVEDLMAYGDFLTRSSEKYKEISDNMGELSPDATEEEQVERLNKTLEITNSIIDEAKERFNNLFKDETAFDRVFGNIKSIETVILVIERVTNYVYNVRKDSINSTAKYTNKYKK